MKYHYADAATGIFSGDWIDTITEEAAVLSARPGTIAVVGVDDWMRQRFDLQKQQLVEHEPVPPSADHVLVRNRWVLKPEVQEAMRKRSEALAEIKRLETEVQPRVLRELFLDPTDQAARARLLELERQIALQRPSLAQQS